MTEQTEIRQKLWQSLEMRCVRRDIILYTVSMLAGSLLTSVISRVPLSGALAIFAVFFLPFIIFWLRRACQIFRSPECYRFFRCKLSQPHQNHFVETMYFTVVLEYPDGSKLIENTHAIFPCHGYIGPLVEDYVNQTVTIAYNEETEMVVVIG